MRNRRWPARRCGRVGHRSGLASWRYSPGTQRYVMDLSARFRNQSQFGQFRRNIRGFIRLPLVQSNINRRIQWLETSTIRQPNITRMLPNHTALLPTIMAKATMQKARNILLTPSNTPRMLDSPASKPTTKANSKSNPSGPTKVGPSFRST